MSKLIDHALTRLAVAIALASPAQVLAWGKTGHRVVAAIAERHLTTRAKRGIARILGAETIIEAANWPDHMRSDPGAFWQKTAGPWHYVTVPPGKTYAEVGVPPEGDAMTALRAFSATLRAPTASLADKQQALRFIVHIVGDLHQPLHVGNGTDKGGNEVRVTFFDRPTNLHSVWDSALVDDEQLSYSEMADWLDRRLTTADVKTWGTPDPTVWIAESSALRERIYPAAGENALGYTYIYRHQREMEDQLTRGGVRLAAYLNQLFGQRR